MSDLYKTAVAALAAKKLAENATLGALRQHEKEKEAKLKAQIEAYVRAETKAAADAAKAERRAKYGPTFWERISETILKIVRWSVILFVSGIGLSIVIGVILRFIE
jgi:hypothetical protein